MLVLQTYRILSMLYIAYEDRRMHFNNFYEKTDSTLESDRFCVPFLKKKAAGIVVGRLFTRRKERWYHFI